MEQNNVPKKILLVDDEAAVAEGVTNSLKRHGITVVRAMDLETAIYQFNQQIFDVVVIELEFESLPGLALAQKFRTNPNEERRQAGIIISCGQQRKAQDDGLMNELGDMDVVKKPLTDVKLLPVLARVLQKRRSIKEYENVRKVCYDFIHKDDLPGAIDHLKTNLQKIGARGLALMAHIYEEAGQLADALKTVDALLQKNPDDIAMLNTKGRLLLKLGETKKAKNFMERADRLAPKNIERVRNMASMYLSLQDPESSTQKMKELIALTPESKDLKFDLFRDLETAGYIEAAVGLCRETTLPTEVIRFYNNKGVIFSREAENQQALLEYSSALRFYPRFNENYRIHFNVAIAEANQKSPENLARAEAALLKCLELAPDFEKAATLLSQIQKTLAHLKKAG